MNAAATAMKTLCEDNSGHSGHLHALAKNRNASNSPFAPINAILAHCENKTGAMMQTVSEYG